MASQAVYHALKAPSDPPRVGGPFKIEIASSAWEDKSLYMPNKGEVIAEWILTKFFKDKANAPPLNPVLDVRFWSLLSKIVSNSRAAKHWLLPVLNRVHIAPVVASFLQHLCAVEAGLHASLTTAVNSSLSIIENTSESDAPLEQIGGLIISSLRSSVGNSSSKKKLSTVFIRNHLHAWILSSSHRKSSDIRENVYTVGVELLFNVDTLRQTHDHNHPLFVALRDISIGLIHPSLSWIFSSFVHCTRKHRSALFAQSSGNIPVAVTDQVHSASFAFFDSCQTLLDAVNPTTLTWEARVGLLTVVGDENLFSSRQLDGQISLQNIVPLVLSELGTNSSAADKTELPIACLSKLMEIDHDLILKDVPRILPELLQLPDAFPSIFGFLEQLLDYHVRTRTMHSHIETLFTALVAHSRNTQSSEYRYRCALSSALLHPIHMERLANCTRKFLTPGQTGQTVTLISETLQGCWDQIYATDSEADSPALTFCFSARLASVVLTALPLHALPATTFQEVSDLMDEIRGAFLPRAVSKALKIIRKNVADSWVSQIATAALLRLQYALDTPYTEKLWAKIEAASEGGQLLPELSLELFRMLLKWSAVDEPARTQDSVDRLLSYLEDNAGRLDTSWSGVTSSLASGPRGKSQSSLAILHMLIDRWLPTMDAIASPTQLQRLAKILFAANIEAYEETRLDATSLLLSALSSAQFWELPNLRAAVLTFVDEGTSVLADPHVKLRADDRALILSTYQLLLVFPIDTLVTKEDLFQAVTVFRVFIQNVSLYLGSIDQPISNLSSYLKHLIHCNTSSQVPQNYTAVTLSLVGLHFSALLKSSEEGSVEAVVDVIRSCLPSDVLSSTNESRVLVRLVETLTNGFTSTSFSKQVQDEIAHLQGRLSAALTSRAEDTGVISGSEELMNLWVHALSLGRWLKISGDPLPLLGRQLCSYAVSAASHDELVRTRIAAFAILAEELHLTLDGDRLSQLDIILATYVSFTRSIGHDQKLDQRLSQTCTTLPVSEFCHVLDLTFECLSDAACSAHNMPHLVHLAALLLSEHPPGTLKHTQKFLTNCLNLFAGRSEFTNGPLLLRLEVLRLLRQQCADSPASLRSLDIGCLWSLLSKFLTKSKPHDKETSTAVFHEITVIVGSLIRLRRDLVALTLPNLGLVLQQLIATIRRPRPQLGAKQTALVTDTLPLWLNSAFPVGPEEGKALARLLETLTTKTTIRSNSSTTDAQRAESLARPFSKHAVYIIKAYIDAMNDPLCILPSELRKELRPGLFALCNMVNDHNRDAMMVSALDAGGKTIMKNLWTEYEKQKYVGKG
ncbi:Urb2/Npa2 family-domain-containing protein [Mycena alexandri]|uniref:Urb2/Npa2 family-domain-containing protein n=1 Tax=Mycena alexandri TaxID=1745969 RepID=A0AAD6X801_9AGAR|nr:Urb2/Npa2 family-domain-containing protein [Mycena alexandri]